MHRVTAAIAGGAAGATVLTGLHQIAKRVTPAAPRLDRLAAEAVRKTLSAVRLPRPRASRLYWATLVGDLAANAAYFSLAGAFGRRPTAWLGPALGAAAGAGALLLPRPMGLHAARTRRTRATEAMTLGVYAAAGVAAALGCRALERGRTSALSFS